MSNAVLELEQTDHLRAILDATSGVLDGLQLLDSCCFGPPEVIEAAAVDLGLAMDALARLGPANGLPPLAQLEADAGEDGRVLCTLIRQQAARISLESSGLSLELRRLLADTRDAIAIATGSPGTYDALGRTTTGSLRRTRCTM
jgi:hypothetical protein